MEINETLESNFITIAPIGELDANSSIKLDEKIRALIDQKQIMIHVDFSDLNYISSAGLGVFISYLDEIQSSGGKLVLSHMAANVKDVFELLGLSKLIPIVENKAAAVNLFNS